MAGIIAFLDQNSVGTGEESKEMLKTILSDFVDEDIVPEGLKVYRIRIKKEKGVQDAIVFAHSKTEIEKMQGCPTPHYVGFDWSWVEKVERISKAETKRLLKTEEAGLADI